MNKRFLAAMMAVLVAGSVFTGCGKAKEEVNTPVVEENTATEEVTEDLLNQPAENTTTEESTATEDSTNSTINSDDYAGIDPSVAQEMLFVITDGIELPSRMNMEAEMFKDTYAIDPSVLSSYVVSMPMMNVHATEIAVFELKDASGADAVKAGIEKRVQALSEQWKMYLPDQYELVQNYKIVEKGNYIIFVISDSADTIVSKFEAYVQ